MWVFLMSAAGRGVVHLINMVVHDYAHVCLCVRQRKKERESREKKNTFVFLLDSEDFEVKSFSVRLNDGFCHSECRRV